MPPYTDEQFDTAEFDKQFAQAQDMARSGFTVAVAVSVVMFGIMLGLLGFGIWVIVQLLQHFGVI